VYAGYCRIGAKSKVNFKSGECIDSIDSTCRANSGKIFPRKLIDFFLKAEIKTSLKIIFKKCEFKN